MPSPACHGQRHRRIRRRRHTRYRHEWDWSRPRPRNKVRVCAGLLVGSFSTAPARAPFAPLGSTSSTPPLLLSIADDQGSTNIRDQQALLVSGFGVLHVECERDALLIDDVWYDRIHDSFIPFTDPRKQGEDLL